MASSDPAARSSLSAGFLFLLAFALLATGAGFAFAPHYSWQVMKIARQAGDLGLSNGALFVGGLVCLGLALVARAAAHGPAQPDTRGESEALQSELHLLNEQLSTKLAQVRASLLQLGETVATLAAQQQQALAGSQASKDGADDPARDAIFRLAASLDKLHAHFDERVHAVDLQLRSGFETLLQVSNEMQRALAETGAGGHATPDLHAHVQAHTLGHAQAAQYAEPPSAVAPNLALYETMQKLDAIAGEGASGPAYPDPVQHGSQPGPALPSQGQNLDLLLPEEYRDRY